VNFLEQSIFYINVFNGYQTNTTTQKFQRSFVSYIRVHKEYMHVRTCMLY